MKKWLITGLVVLVLVAAAVSVHWWLRFLPFSQQNSDLIQGHSGAIEMVLWLGAGLASVIRLWWSREKAQDRSGAVRETQSTEAGGVIIGGGNATVEGDIVGRDVVAGDEIVYEAAASVVPAPQQLPPSSLYPSIDPETEHVVQNRSFRVSVSLQLTPSPATPGEVELPPGEEHILDVHLLLGENSAWDKLVWSGIQGTTKKAEFAFVAPFINPRQDGTVPDRQYVSLAANFYLNGRWCGEGLRSIEVLLNDDVAPSAFIPPPSAAKWSELLNLEPGAEPPDLLVRIQIVVGDVYEWILLSPHLDLRPRPGDLAGRKELKNGSQRFVRTNFNRISGEALNEESIPVIEARCREIYKSTADTFKEAYWKLFFAEREAAEEHLATGEGAHGKLPELKSIQFISDEPYVPWELMLVRDDQRGPGVKEEILSIRHSVGRWVAKASGRLKQSIFVREMAVFASDYAQVNVEPKLPWAIEEREMLASYGAKCGALKFDPLMRFLKEGTAQVVHFSCHGEMNVELPTESALCLEDFPKFVTAYVAQDEVREGEGSKHPLVFLNACQLASAGPQLGLVTGWPQTFLEAGASACIAPLWSVIDANAKEASSMFYRLVFREHKTLGQALQEIRKEWRKRNSLTFLSYVLYGDPSAQVFWSSPLAGGQASSPH